MSDIIKRQSHVTVTRRTTDGVTHTEVHMSERITTTANVMSGAHTHHQNEATEAAATGASHAAVQQNNQRTQRPPVAEGKDDDCFHPEYCCSAREQAMIAALRAYLRPATAPDCLVARLRAALDDYCK